MRIIGVALSGSKVLNKQPKKLAGVIGFATVSQRFSRQRTFFRGLKNQDNRSPLMASAFFSNLFGGSASPKTGGCPVAPKEAPPGLELATFAGGCFWGIELAFQRVPGVVKTSVGYTAGKSTSPTYEEVCSGRSGHTEAVQMIYDPKEVSYDQLLDVFFGRTDVTTLNRQGNDVGTQYRSGIYFHNEAQKEVAARKLKEVEAKLGKKVVAELLPASDYYIAEEYHQQYLAKGGRNGRAQSAAKNCTDPIRCYG